MLERCDCGGRVDVAETRRKILGIAMVACSYIHGGKSKHFYSGDTA
jgi:hypothetical protein